MPFLGRPSRFYSFALASIIALSSAAAITVPSNAEGSRAEAAAPVASELYKQIEELVKEYYPKAKFSSADGTLHFDYKTRQHLGSYSNKTELSPDLGGIIGDLKIKSGTYGGREKLPTELNEYVHVVLLMAPYKKSDNSHLMARITYPPDTAAEFLERVKTLVNSYNKGEADSVAATTNTTTTTTTGATTAPTTTTTTTVTAPANTTASASSTTTTAASTAPAATPASVTSPPDTTAPASTAESSKAAGVSTTFGAAKLSKYSYPEGRFRVLLPGAPQMKYQSQMGMRMVDYLYPEAQGTYNISYVILPNQANPAALNAFFDKLAASVVNDVKGAQSTQTAINLQGYPGRQIDVPILKDKAGQIARFRIYVVRRFVYVVAAAGKKAWVESPIVSQFMGSFEVTPELTAAEQAQQQQREMERERNRQHEEFERRMAESRQRSAETSSRLRKDSEHSRMQYENNRWRRP